MSGVTNDRGAAPRPVAIVTGAASGIGLAAARRFLRSGFAVGICDRSEALHRQFTTEIRDGLAVAVIGDVTDAGVRGALVDAVRSRFGRLDVLVNNAATGGESATVGALDLDDLRRTLEVNVVAVIGLVQLALPLLVASGAGRIVNVGSLFGDEPVAGGAPYCVSKGAIHTLTRSLAVELGPQNIVCNTVAPGYILTPMHAEEVEFQAAERGMTAEERYAELRSEVPLGRHGTPDDVASTILWLATPESAYVTGQKIAVNGGVAVG